MNTIPLRSRYGKTHRLVPVPEINNKTYRYEQAEEWMPMYINYDNYHEENDENDLISVDTDGGPYFSVGCELKDMVINRIYEKNGYGILIEFV